MNTQCIEFRSYAGDWMEGRRLPQAEAHLRQCAACRSLIQDLETIRQAAGTLGAEAAEPPERLWAAIRARAEAEGLIREAGWADRLRNWWPALPRPALATASFAVVFALAAWVGLQVQPQVRLAGPTEAGDSLAEFRASVDRAGEQAATVIAARNPAVAVSYRENLAIVDNFILLCEKTVREQPQNQLAREYLYGALQQKAELVATVMERGTLGE